MAADEDDQTITCRSKEQIAEDLLDRLMESNRELLHNMIKATYDPLMIGVHITVDYSEIEARILSRMVSGQEYYKKWPEIFDLDDLPKSIERITPVKPVKQNGRSAAYLKHDRSKRPRGY